MVHTIGHHEFGPDKCCINLGDREAVRRIRDLWQKGRSVEGWSLYWSEIYAHILRRIDEDPAFARACLIIRFEDLCRDSANTIDRILEHCSLCRDAFGSLRQYYIDKLREPTYYKPSFDEGELALVGEITAPVAARLGYRSYQAS